jgi:hypothetical protein
VDNKSKTQMPQRSNLPQALGWKGRVKAGQINLSCCHIQATTVKSHGLSTEQGGRLEKSIEAEGRKAAVILSEHRMLK